MNFRNIIEHCRKLVNYTTFIDLSRKKTLTLKIYTNLRSIIFKTSASSIKMSENIPSTSTKKFINSSTQHGNESNADEENIVVLAKSFSPTREVDDPVVWHEDFQQNEDVSTCNFNLI
jgi:hypothetical protein